MASLLSDQSLQDHITKKKQEALAEQKSQLARMLANENIRIVHSSKVTTASFNIARRILTLPVWKNVTPELYDLLVGHEVGHALWSKKDEWMGAITRLARKHFPKNIKQGEVIVQGVLNVVEDARIEKLIKRKYPGIRRSFAMGYETLWDRDFFQVRKGQRKVTLIDKMNIMTKIVTLPTFTLTQEETDLLDDINACETAKEVEAVSERLLQHVKDQIQQDTQDQAQQQKKQKQKGSGQAGDSGGESDDDDGESESGNKGKSSSKGKQKQKSESEDGDDEGDDDEKNEAKGSKKANEKGEEEEDDDTDGDDSQDDEGGAGSDGDDDDSEGEGSDDGDDDENESDSDSEYDSEGVGRNKGGLTKDEKPVSKSMPEEELTDEELEEFVAATVEALKKAVESLVDKEGKNIIQANLNPAFEEALIIPWRDALKSMQRAHTKEGRASAEAIVDRYFQNEKATVNYAVAQFELRKAAMSQIKAKITKSGVIDTNKLHSYHFNDDIFRRYTENQKGKNHGLIFLMDWSSSMDTVLRPLVLQLMGLMMYCRQLRVPFEVYAFNDNIRRGGFKPVKDGEVLVHNHFTLVQFFSHKMSPADFKTVCVELLCEVERSGGKAYPTSGTPLNEAMYAMCDIVPRFKRDNNVDIVSFTLMSDGCGMPVMVNYKNLEGHEEALYAYGVNNDVTYHDPITKRTYKRPEGYSPSMAETCLLAKIIKDRTGCNTIGYYVCPPGGSTYYGFNSALNTVSNNDKPMAQKDKDALSARFNQQGYASVPVYGFDQYMIINQRFVSSSQQSFAQTRVGGTPAVPNDDYGDTWDDDGTKKPAPITNATDSQIGKAFGEYVKRKQNTRRIINTFVETMASATKNT